MEPLRVLIVESSEDDVLRLTRRLRAEGFDAHVQRVDTAEALLDALAAHGWDLVITDQVLPRLNGLNAISLVKQAAPDLPCIVVSDQLGEQMAVEAMRAGAHDYLLKEDLRRLAPAIRRELQDARVRQERSAAEAAFLAEKERLAVTLRSIGDAVVATDTDGRITLFNEVAEQLCGWSAVEAIGQPLSAVLELLDGQTRQPIRDLVARVLERGEVTSARVDGLLVARDEEQRLVAATTAAIRDPQGQIVGAVLVLRDVTERRRLERELLRAQKLESVGVLAGGIAHDFNNILTGVLGNISLARFLSPPDDAIHPRLFEAEKALVRARDLTMQLLTFAKGGQPVCKAASIGELLVDATSFALRGSNVRCEFTIADDLWPVDVDEGQIGQVVQNLVLNAAQAMPHGGTIELAATNVRARPEDSWPAPDQAEGIVRITVRDHGPGIPEELLDRIFDPYFTTKPGGSGLGLATCFSIVQKHHGRITVESRTGAGSTFCVQLPASSVPPPPSAPVLEAVMPPGQGRVLVMDDEGLVRSVASMILGHLGYQAETVADGQAAVEGFGQALAAGRPFAAVILDLTVPGGMGGKEAARRILQQEPHAPLIVSSGYSSDPIMAEYRRHGFRGMVKKPYTVRELARALSEVITGRQPSREG